MLKQFPLLRILVPFVCGIVVCYNWDCSEVFIASIFAAAVLSAIALNIMSRFPRSETFFGHKQPANFRRKPSTVMKLRGWQILPIVLLSAALGMLCLSLSRPSVLPNDCFGKMAAARVTSIIHKNSSMSMDAEITQIKGFQVSNKHKIKLSIAQNDYSLRENCIIAFRLNPETITENSNPGDFNYGRYLFLKGFL